MAKQKKKRNKKYKQKYTTDNRVDYRQGGRVSLAHGGMPVRGNYGYGPMGQQQYETALASWNAEHAPDTETTRGAADPNRTERVQDTGQRAEELAQGQIDLGPDAIIPQRQEIKQDDQTRIQEGTGQMGGVLDTSGPTVGVDREQVKTESVSQARENVQTPIKKAGTTTVKDVIGPATGVTTGRRGIDSIAQQTLTDTRDFAQAQVQPGSEIETLQGGLSGKATVEKIFANPSAQVSSTPDAEKQTRDSIVDSNAVGRNASQILDVAGYDAVERRTVTGKAAKGAAASMIAQTASIPQSIAAAIVEDPASVEAQVDTNPVEVNAAIAALPTEALVSSQMETLLAGMEDGNIPLWAKPAVDAVNQNMATRGMLPSTVGRDALFNAVIQSAFPMAQGNAQALQQRAAQNLSNEQQANLQQATQVQQLRLNNLANRQTAESQTAQMSQQMKTMQSQFTQQAVMTTAQQQQQTTLQNLQNQQQAAVLNSQQQQQINVQNLGNEQQIEVANLQVEAQAAAADQSEENKSRLAEFQIAADFMAKNAGLTQDMNKANLAEETKIRLANLSALNQAESQNLSAAQQTELANLNKKLQVNIRNADLAQQMGVAQLNVEQQSAMQNAQIVANMDMTKFNTAQQVELANSKFMQTVTLANMDSEQQAIMQEATALSQLDVANLGVRERLQVESAKNFLTYDMANLNNSQQASILKSQQFQQRLLSDQAALNASEQFNATSENQMNQFMTTLGSQLNQYNITQQNQMKQFNATNQNSAEARRAGNLLQSRSLEAQLGLDSEKFNSQQQYARDQFNEQQEMIIAQSNVEWRRKANTADTAAFNAVNQQNAQNAFNLSSSANNFLWQELRDEADFNFKRWDNDQQRKTSMLIAALGNEQGVNRKDSWDDNMSALFTVLGGFLS